MRLKVPCPKGGSIISIRGFGPRGNLVFSLLALSVAYKLGFAGILQYGDKYNEKKGSIVRREVAPCCVFCSSRSDVLCS